MSPVDLPKILKNLTTYKNDMPNVMEKIKQLLVGMLDIDPEKRPAIQTVARILKECTTLFTLRECKICMCDYNISDMIKCKSKDLFCCKEMCFKQFVAHKTKEMNENQLGIPCFAYGEGCGCNGFSFHIKHWRYPLLMKFSEIILIGERN